MSNERLPRDIDFDRLLEELGLSDSDVPHVAVNYLSQCEFDELLTQADTERHARILDQSQRWIAFLQNQADALTAIARLLYDRLAVLCDLTDFDAGRAQTDLDLRARLIDRVEWTLIALESWIEEHMPSDAEARFRIQWTDRDGLASWTAAGQDSTAPVSLKSIVVDGAETEGEFPPDVADVLASLVVDGIRGGDVQLPRLRRLADDSGSDESLFELVPRGEAYQAEVALAHDSGALLPAELEAQLSRPETSQLATLLDEASYAAAARVEVGGAREPLFTQDIVDGVTRVAARCRIPSSEMARCLMTLVEGRLDSALRARDHEASVRLAKAASTLTRVVLQVR